MADIKEEVNQKTNDPTFEAKEMKQEGEDVGTTLHYGGGDDKKDSKVVDIKQELNQETNDPRFEAKEMDQEDVGTTLHQRGSGSGDKKDSKMADIKEELNQETNDPTFEAKEMDQEDVGTTSYHRATSDEATSYPSSRENLKYAWITELRNFLKVRRIEFAMSVTRLATVFFATFAIFPVFGDSYNFSRRALICNGATSALRLYQRVPWSPNLAELIGRVFLEDSCHYLMYSLIFLFLGHVSFALIPIYLFAILHVSSFYLQALGVVYGPSATSSGLGSVLFICKNQTSRILKWAASAEVCLMGLIIINVLGGQLSILTPLAYYRFIKFRYISKRNPNTRAVFSELRLVLEQFISSGSCPSIVARILRGFITLLCKLAPA